jgi:glutathionylspermidine synthase
VVGEEAAGIGIREDDSPITRNSSRFVPHYFT